MNTLFNLFAADDETSMTQWLHYELILDMRPFLETFFEKHLDDPWNMKNLSRNKGLTEDIILEYPYLKWYWDEVTKNDKISLKFIEDHPEFPWCYKSLSGSSKLTTEFLLKHIDNERWNFKYLSGNRALTSKIIKMKKEKKWDLTLLSRNSSIPVSYILKSFKKVLENPRSRLWYELSKRVTETILEKNLDRPWRASELLHNPNISLEFIEKHFDDIPKLKDPSLLSQSPKINSDFIKKHPEIEWEYWYLSSNSAIDIDYILETPHEEWDIEDHLRITLDPIGTVRNMMARGVEVEMVFVSQSRNLTPQMMIDNPDLGWIFGEYTFGEDEPIPFELFERFPDGEWDWDLLSIKLQFPRGRAREIINQYRHRFFVGSLVLNESLKYEDVRDIVLEYIDNHREDEDQLLYSLSQIYLNESMAVDAFKDGKIPVDYDFLASNPVILR